MSSKRDLNGGNLHCSFCGKSQREVKKLIAGPTVYICDECIQLCNEIIAEEANEPAEQARAALERLHDLEGQVEGADRDAREKAEELRVAREDLANKRAEAVEQTRRAAADAEAANERLGQAEMRALDLALDRVQVALPLRRDLAPAKGRTRALLKTRAEAFTLRPRIAAQSQAGHGMVH